MTPLSEIPINTRTLLQLALIGVTIGLVASAACDAPSEKSRGALQEAVEKIGFVRDARTGLCFAMLGSTTYSGYIVTSITAVPCDAVPQ
jgi:hypothetical protein